MLRLLSALKFSKLKCLLFPKFKRCMHGKLHSCQCCSSIKHFSVSLDIQSSHCNDSDRSEYKFLPRIKQRTEYLLVKDYFQILLLTHSSFSVTFSLSFKNECRLFTFSETGWINQQHRTTCIRSNIDPRRVICEGY